MNLIFNRKSIRKYKNKDVEDSKIEMLLRAGMAAPSAANQQPWEFYVVKDKELLEKLSQSSRHSACVKDAPLAIVPCYRTKSLILEKSVHLDMSASVQNILLEAVDQELGAVWLGVAPTQERMETVRQILDINDDLEPFAIISCGYPLNDEIPQDRYDETRVHYLN